jgi:SAM-dependent methyltransferase
VPKGPLSSTVRKEVSAGVIGDGVFDVVRANMVVEHLMAPGAVFAEVQRVLRPGGQFNFVTPNLNSPYMRAAAHTPDGVKRMLARVFEGRAENDVFPTTYRMNTEPSLRAQPNAQGFASSAWSTGTQLQSPPR